VNTQDINPARAEQREGLLAVHHTPASVDRMENIKQIVFALLRAAERAEEVRA